MKRIKPPFTARTIIRIVIFLFVGYFVFEYFTLPSANIIALRENDPAFSALMQLRRENFQGEREIRYSFVPLNKISPHFIRAVIAVEDGGFYRHTGFDWNALETAYQRNIKSGRIRFGGSTITMQLAKNLFLSDDRSYLRKAKEAILTLRLEKHLSKKRILELYLNIIELGDGIFGAEAAARHYFKKPASAMTRDEAIRLAAIISSPLKHSPFENTRFINIRKNIIFRKMGR